MNDENDPVALFCNSKEPKLEDFIKITDEDKLNAIKDFLSNAPEDDYLTHLVFTILKLSSISEESKDAQQIALELFKEAFEYAKTKDRVSIQLTTINDLCANIFLFSLRVFETSF